MFRTISISVALVAILLGSVCTSGAAAAIAADFEDISLPPNSYFNGGPNTSTNVFNSRGVLFPNTYDATFDVWDGWAISSKNDVATPGYGNQYSAYNLPSGGGAGGSPNFAVGFPSFSTGLTVQLSAGYNPTSVNLTNTTYAALSMRNGDAFAKKFGGPSGNDPDYFYVTIRGLDASQQTVGSVNFYLADYRFTDNSQDYIVDHWTPVDLTTLTGARTLSLDFTSSDVGMFGINTPTYVALDDLLITSKWKAGDFNLDGRTDVGDLSAMMSALGDLSAYQNGGNSQSVLLTDDQMHSIGDIDTDGKVTNADLQGLLNLLADGSPGGAVSAVPEPAGWLLAAIAALTAGLAGGRRGRSILLSGGAQ